MLKKETINQLAALAKLTPAALEAALVSTEEVDVAIPAGLTTLDANDLQTIKNNEYNSGKGAGVEMAVKDVKTELGLDFQGKDLKALVEAANKKALAEANLNPDARVAELQTRVTELQGTVTTFQTKLSEKDKEVQQVQIKSELYKHIPAPGENGPKIGADDVLALMGAAGYAFQLTDGKTIAVKDGQPVRDTLSNPVPPADVIKSFMTERKLISEQQGQATGRGGGSQTAPNRPMKLSDIKAEFEAQKKSTNGQEFMAAVAEATKTEGFDMNA